MRSAHTTVASPVNTQQVLTIPGPLLTSGGRLPPSSESAMSTISCSVRAARQLFKRSSKSRPVKRSRRVRAPSDSRYPSLHISSLAFRASPTGVRQNKRHRSGECLQVEKVATSVCLTRRRLICPAWRQTARPPDLATEGIKVPGCCEPPAVNPRPCEHEMRSLRAVLQSSRGLRSSPRSRYRAASF